jgi:hypothetical protein
MSERPDRKPYVPPVLFRVELNHEQAILSACSVGVASTRQGNVGGACKVNCKQGNGTGDNSARSS